MADEALSTRLSQVLADPKTTPTDRLTITAFLRFLTNKDTRPEDRQAHMAFLEASPKYSEPTSYICDIEQRRELLHDIQQRFAKHRYEITSTAALWSTLMVVPLDRLRSFHELYLSSPILFPTSTAVLNDVATKIPVLLKVFLTKNLSQSDLIFAHGTRKRTRSSTYSQASSATDKQNRDKNEKQKCVERDKYCVVTGAANPDICHIFPFAAKKNPNETSSGLSVLLRLWDDQVFQRYMDLLVGDGNIIDTAANMVALQPLLHRWWSQAIIGFEPIEKIEKGIRLRFRWLRKTKLNMSDEVSIDLDPIDYFVSHSDQDHIRIAHSETHRPIINGTVIEITAQDDSAIPSWDLFSLQWDLIRMASLCGAAEASDDDDWEPDSDDEALLQAEEATTMDIDSLATPGFLPLRPLPVQPRESSPTKSSKPWESSPTKTSQPRESSPAKSSQPQKLSPAKSHGGRVDENNPW